MSEFGEWPDGIDRFTAAELAPSPARGDGVEYPSERDVAAMRSIDEARIPEYPPPVTAPTRGGADEIREQVAAALRGSAHVCGWDVPCPCYDWRDEEYDAAVHATAVSAGRVDEVQGIPEAFADALLPTVQALIAKGAAAELRAVAVEIDDGGPHGERDWLARILRERAATLDGSP